jgi:hypothetical protein
MDYSQGGGRSTLIEGRRKTWRRNFNGTSLNPDYWQTVALGAGQTISVSGGALTVNMNTTINSETIIQSIESFTIPFRVQFTHSMSQRIVNNEVYLEVVNAAGNTYQGWMFDGTTTTTAKTVHMNGGNSQPASPSGAVTIAGTSTTAVIREMDARMDAVDFSDRTADSNSVASVRATRTRTTLDPEEKYYIRMRFKNLGTAPASNTTNTIETVLVQDINDIPVEIAAGRGNNASNRTVPVQINNTPNVTLSNSATGMNATMTGTAATAVSNQAVLGTPLSVKGSAGKVFGFTVSNPGAAAAYFNLYNQTAVTLGTTVPTVQILVPAGQTLMYEMTLGIDFPTGIIMAATDISAPLSAVAPATGLIASVFRI